MGDAKRRKLLFLVTEDWYFWSHRLPMARAAAAAGFDVYVATRCDRHSDRIRREGFVVLPLAWKRQAHNPLSALVEIGQIAHAYAKARPDIVHHVALKSVVYGGIAGLLTRTTPVVNALTGLGFAFRSKALTAVAIRQVLRPVLRFLLTRPKSLLVVQNADDAKFLVEAGLVRDDNVRIVRGSGVDTLHFSRMDEPAGIFTIGYVGRMLEDKGVRTVIAAHQLLRQKGIETRLLLAGDTDITNPTAISSEELTKWSTQDDVEWLGHVEDVRTVWARSHLAVLASRHEGLPLSLLEAAACGRAIVATDVPGCREVAVAGRNALTVPVDDPGALARAIERLACDASLRRSLARASRELVEQDLSAFAVGKTIVEIYEEVLDDTRRGTVP